MPASDLSKNIEPIDTYDTDQAQLAWEKIDIGLVSVFAVVAKVLSVLICPSVQTKRDPLPDMIYCLAPWLQLLESRLLSSAASTPCQATQ